MSRDEVVSGTRSIFQIIIASSIDTSHPHPSPSIDTQSKWIRTCTERDMGSTIAVAAAMPLVGSHHRRRRIENLIERMLTLD